MRILVIDNYDSFVYNLVQYIGQLGFSGDDCVVLRNDAPELTDAHNPDRAGADALPDMLQGFDAILLSPGPGEPSAAGRMLDVLNIAVEQQIPLFGVCLGHQAIGMHFGAEVVRADELFHGKTSPVTHDGTGVLTGVPSPFRVTRYHSLTVDPDTVPEELKVTATSDSGMIMAMRHQTLPIHSVQFHPESVMTQYGHLMLANWLNEAGRLSGKGGRGSTGEVVPAELVDRLVQEQLEVTGAISAEASML
ncbi:aminodeoxychorismate/anthranilate synthase component II [uncultured Corynebacterium sp.]|uniref:anthranilate synthase component II n=1 Tax=uncultured Corynebacterium sp. TaxID=159447 RepID=UPI0025DD4E9C|nr:gamma-glutamyl-gamma-aminobutyrate hydrolase family protein [uncultured Corynebacterium sp.]